MLVALLIFLIGLLLSAFFSGSETGFYRVSRVRLLIDAVGGDRVAKGLLWASNNPGAFVATALVGNNAANNVTALAIVMLTGALLPGVPFAEMALTFALAPVVFLFGELLPKKLFFRAPYRLLRRCAPGLAASTMAFAPLSVLLWLFSLVLQRVSRAPAQTIRMSLARRELPEVLDEGHAAGLLTPIQRRVAQRAFALGGRPLRDFMTPTQRSPKATTNMSRRDVLRIASRWRLAAVPVEEPTGSRRLVGYVSAVDCLLAPEAPELPLHPLTYAGEEESYLTVLLRTQDTDAPLVGVRGPGDAVVGFVSAARLREALLIED